MRYVKASATIPKSAAPSALTVTQTYKNRVTALATSRGSEGFTLYEAKLAIRKGGLAFAQQVIDAMGDSKIKNWNTRYAECNPPVEE